MRIGFFTDSFVPRIDGIAISVENYRAGIEKLGHEVFVFCPDHPGIFNEQSERIYRFKSIPSILYDSYRDTFPFLPKHIRFIRNLKLDIVHTFTQLQIGLLGTYIAKKENLPLIGTCNTDLNLVDEYFRLIPGSLILVFAMTLVSRSRISLPELRLLLKKTATHESIKKKFIKTCAAYYFNKCSVLTVQSEKIKRSLDPFLQKPAIVLPAPTDLALVPNKNNIKVPRNKYGLPESSVLFVSSSRFVREKRIDFLIRSFDALSDKDKKGSGLVLIGDGVEYGKLKALVKKFHLENNIFFMGRISHQKVYAILSKCNIYVHVSLRETQGLVLNEAAACGLPLIMIDKEANPVLHEGQNGYYAKNSIADFAHTMSLLLNEPKKRLMFGKQSQIFAKETSKENIARKLEQIYISQYRQKR